MDQNPRPTKRYKSDEPYTLVIVGAGATAIWVAKTFLKNHEQGNVLLISSPVDQNAPGLSDKVSTGKTFYSAAEIGTEFRDLQDGYQLHVQERVSNSINSHHYIEVPIYHSCPTLGKGRIKDRGYTLVEKSWSSSILPETNALYHQAGHFKLLLHPDYFSDERKYLERSFSSRLTIKTGYVESVKQLESSNSVLVSWKGADDHVYGSLTSHVVLACGLGYAKLAKASGLEFRNLVGEAKKMGGFIPEVYPAKVIGVDVSSKETIMVPPCFIHVDCAPETFNLYIRSNLEILVWFNSKNKEVKADPAVFKGYLEKKFNGTRGAQAKYVLACSSGRYVVWETTVDNVWFAGGGGVWGVTLAPVVAREVVGKLRL